MNELELALSSAIPDFNHLDLRHGHPNQEKRISKPALLTK